jgi:hypothetical protein
MGGIMMYNLSREEQETTINWCRVDNIATIDTADPVEIRKLDRLVKAFPDVYKVQRIDAHYNAKTYTVPAKHIRFGKPASKRQIENAQRNSQYFRQKPTESVEVQPANIHQGATTNL